MAGYTIQPVHGEVDLDNAQSQASERWIKVQDVTFELERSKVALLRATGDLETCALGAK